VGERKKWTSEVFHRNPQRPQARVKIQKPTETDERSRCLEGDCEAAGASMCLKRSTKWNFEALKKGVLLKSRSDTQGSY